MGKKIIIIDLGTYSTKVGTAGAKEPQYSIKTIMGYSKNSEHLLFGDEALKKSQEPLPLMDYKWDIMEIRWSKIFEFIRYIFEEKLVLSMSELKKYSLILLIGPLQPRSHFLKYYEAFFTKFKIAKMLVISATRVALLASRNTTGLVVDIGYKSTRVVPLYEGFRLPHAFNHQDLAGKDIDEYDETILQYPTVPEKEYLAPTSEIIIKAIERCDESIREELYSNIILTGWWSANEKVATLLKAQLEKKRKDKNINIITPSTHYYNWLSASLLAINKLRNLAKIKYLSKKEFYDKQDSDTYLTLAGIKTKKWGLISYPL
jgi:actin-related protein